MEYVYAAMLLHAAKHDISEKSLAHVLEAAGVKAEDTKLKAMVASLKEVNIDEAIKSAALPTVAAPAAAPAAEAKAEKKEDTAKSEEAAAEGLGALFG